MVLQEVLGMVINHQMLIIMPCLWVHKEIFLHIMEHITIIIMVSTAQISTLVEHQSWTGTPKLAWAPSTVCQLINILNYMEEQTGINNPHPTMAVNWFILYLVTLAPRQWICCPVYHTPSPTRKKRVVLLSAVISASVIQMPEVVSLKKILSII